MNINTAVEQVKTLYYVAETANNLAAGERSVEQWTGASAKDFIKSLDFNQYAALLDLYACEDEGDAGDWLEHVQQLVSSFSDEQIELFSRIKKTRDTDKNGYLGRGHLFCETPPFLALGLASTTTLSDRIQVATLPP